MSIISTNYTQQNLYSSLFSNSTQQSSLSGSQKSGIEEILSNYDASNLTSEDATEIIEAFEELGVNPSAELESYLDELGFDAAKIGQLSQGSSPQGSMPPPPPPREVQDELAQTISELYGDSEDDSTSTNPYASSDTSVSFSNLLDYTSRILSLNEDTQEEVMELFESYNSADDKSSLANSVRTTLAEILSNQDNYSALSLYA